MSTMLDPLSAASDPMVAGQRLRSAMTAMRLGFVWFGTRKSLTVDQKTLAAEAFHAEREFLSAGKKLVDTRHPAFKAVTAARSRAIAYWKGISLPYPEAGIRLIRRDAIGSVDVQMNTLKGDLTEAVEVLEDHLGELKIAAQVRLGSLYNANDYPASLHGLFEMTWDFPSIEPPAYLQRLNPEIYRQECQRVVNRFDQAVELAEQAFLDELARMISHLSERLSGSEDGNPKVFRDSSVENLTEFFQRFRNLNISCSEQLDALVAQAQAIVKGIQPQQLRDSQSLRQCVATELSGVQSVLEGMLVERPRRNILRRPK